MVVALKIMVMILVMLIMIAKVPHVEAYNCVQILCYFYLQATFIGKLRQLVALVDVSFSTEDCESIPWGNNSGN